MCEWQGGGVLRFTKRDICFIKFILELIKKDEIIENIKDLEYHEIEESIYTRDLLLSKLKNVKLGDKLIGIIKRR